MVDPWCAWMQGGERRARSAAWESLGFLDTAKPTSTIAVYCLQDLNSIDCACKADWPRNSRPQQPPIFGPRFLYQPGSGIGLDG